MPVRTKVLLIEHGAAPLTYGVISCLSQSQNYELHVLSFGDERRPFYKYSNHVKSFTSYNKIDSDEYDLSFEIIRDTAFKLKADIVLPIMERSIDTVSRRLPELLAIAKVPPLPTPEIFDQAIDKLLLYCWLYENKYSIIKPVVFTDLLENKINKEQLKLPFLIKPFWGSDGNGIVQVRTDDDFNRIFTQDWPDKEFLLIQPFIEGYDIDISFLAEDGKIIASAIQKAITKEKGFKYSRDIAFVKDEKLLELTSMIVKDLNFSGIAHLDYRYDIINSRYELVDFNCRYWSSILGSLSVGINFPELSCQRAMGKDISEQIYRTDNYFETNNVFEILYNTSFKTGNSFPNIHNTQFKYYWKDAGIFFHYNFKRVFSKLKWLFLKLK